jgi:predicted kinase
VRARVLVVVSGLPASGKTTVGRLLSERLSMPLIDKDAILEAMFDSLGCQDRDERSRLSRASDEVLYTVAETSPAAILVNWWNHDSSPPRLRDITSSLVEVFCDCPVEVAAARFEARRRHPGHQDADRSPEEIEEGVRRTSDGFRGPLGVGHLVRIDTLATLDADSLTGRVRSALEAVAHLADSCRPPLGLSGQCSD